MQISSEPFSPISKLSFGLLFYTQKFGEMLYSTVAWLKISLFLFFPTLQYKEKLACFLIDMNFVFPYKRNHYQQFMDWKKVFVCILSTILNISLRYYTAVDVRL